MEVAAFLQFGLLSAHPVHLVAAPAVVAHHLEAEAPIEPFGLGVAVVHEQSGGQSHPPAFLHRGHQQLAGNAVAAVVGAHADRVDIEFSSSRLVAHVAIVDAKRLQGLPG